MNMRIAIVSLILVVCLLVPGQVLASDDGWTHGSLFSAPNWLLDRIDQSSREMSSLDYYGVRMEEPTQKPPTYKEYVAEGWGYLQAGSYREALKSFEKALAENGTSTEAWYGRGLALENQKRYLSANDAYEKAVSYAKSAADSWGPYAGMGRAYIAIQQYENAKNSLQTAIEQYEKANVSYPDEISQIYQDLAKALEMLGDMEGADKALQMAGLY